MDFSIEEFICLLWEQYCLSSNIENIYYKNNVWLISDLLSFAHRNLWIEDQDEVFSKNNIDKRSCARILYSFSKRMLKRTDVVDISMALTLKDIYTCRSCVNAVAQMYCKNIMEAEEYVYNGQQIMIFNMTRPIKKEEALLYIKRALAC